MITIYLKKKKKKKKMKWTYGVIAGLLLSPVPWSGDLFTVIGFTTRVGGDLLLLVIAGDLSTLSPASFSSFWKIMGILFHYTV